MLHNGQVSATRATYLTLAAALLVLATKLVAYLLTGSIALLSDAAESIVNVAAALAVLYAVRQARRPPDYLHPYGHAKAEYLSAALEGTMILLAAGFLLATAAPRLLDPPPLDNVTVGVAVAALAAASNGATAYYLRRVGSKAESVALISNSRHLLTDVWTSLGVIVAVILVAITGWAFLDPLVGIAVGLNIVREGWQVLTGSLSSLLDERLPEDEERVVMGVLEGHESVLGFHQLRSRRAGFRRFIEVDVFVEPRLDVIEAHDIATALKSELGELLPNLTVTIHVEPYMGGERDTTRTPREEFPG